MGNLATNIGYASGRHQKPNDFWDFLVYFMNEYDTDDKITRIVEIEKELTEREAKMPEQEHEELRQEYRTLLVKCFDEAICNTIDRDFPGGCSMASYGLRVPKFNVGDKKTVKKVKDASSVGYLGYWGKVLFIKFNEKENEFMYYLTSIIGTGGAWFYESEL